MFNNQSKFSPFYIFWHYAAFSESKNMIISLKYFWKKVFCAFWGLDIAPTLDVLVLLAIALTLLGRCFQGRNSILAAEVLEFRWHEVSAPVEVNEPWGSEDGKNCRNKFDDATRRDVPVRESERKIY